MTMSPFILLLVFHVGYGTSSAAIEMPDLATCERELNRLHTAATYELSYGLCLDRQPH